MNYEKHYSHGECYNVAMDASSENMEAYVKLQRQIESEIEDE